MRAADGLTDEQVWAVKAAFREWLTLKERHEGNRGRNAGTRWQPGELTRLNADIDHSALLARLLSGKDALPEPPPVQRAYPVYPD